MDQIRHKITDTFYLVQFLSFFFFLLLFKCWRMSKNKNMISPDSVIAEMSLLFLISWHFVAGLCAIWYVLTFSEHCVCVAKVLRCISAVCANPNPLKEWHLSNRTSVGADAVFFFFSFFLHKFLNKNIISQTTSTASHTICFLYLLPSKVICDDKIHR